MSFKISIQVALETALENHFEFKLTFTHENDECI